MLLLLHRSHLVAQDDVQRVRHLQQQQQQAQLTLNQQAWVSVVGSTTKAPEAEHADLHPCHPCVLVVFTLLTIELLSGAQTV